MQIRRRDFLIGSGLATSLLSQSVLAADDNKRPNVILVCVDDVGFSDLGFNGNPVIKTPYLNRMAKQGLNLTNFHTSTVCAPGRAAIMTGRDHLRVGVWSTTMDYYRIRRDETVMAELFQLGGYATAMFGKWHLGNNYPYRPRDRGFGEVVRCGGGGVSQTPDYWGNDYYNDTYFHNGKPERYEGYCADVWFDEAMRFVDENRNQPFFVYLAPNTAHWPPIVPRKYMDIYKDDPRLKKPIYRRGKLKQTPLDHQVFYGMITNIDYNMGRLDAKLKELGLFENTIVLFTSDNGSRDPDAVAGFVPRFKGGKASSVADGGTRVPTLVRWPDGGLQPPGSVDNRLTCAQDLLPTFMDVCDLPNPKGTKFDGKSILPLLRGSDRWPDRTLFEQQQSAIHPDKKFHKFCVRTQRWRLYGDNLYEIEKDPRQKNNLAKEYPEVAKRLRNEYSNWYDELEPSFSNLSHIVVGNPAENPSVLTCHDWAPAGADLERLLRLEKTKNKKPKLGVPWLQKSVAHGVKVNGYWHIDVERPGAYRVELRRWPREEDKPMEWGGRTAGHAAVRAMNKTAGKPPRKHLKGKALKIDAVRLKIGDMFDETKPVKKGDKAEIFEVSLPKGKTRLQTWMINNEKPSDNVGAYFVYITRV